MTNLFTYSFLGLNYGFWFFAFPLTVIWISSHLYLKEKDKNTLRTLEDFGILEDLEESELFKIEFKINKEEKWKIGQVLKRSKYDTVDELIRNSLYEMIK
ncbi:hypothetical protein [Clostridium beijerinckii]|uniref:hypothetical protein n=1 Tax=Clostridium beijerinckii TaxID=1520 RepID=UPI00232D7F43|nr:hypothetical protein [Clostridium beijerinckii]